MLERISMIALLAAGLACSYSQSGTPRISAQETELSCIVMRPDGMEERLSPLDSLDFEIDGAPAKICYGRPSARGRTMLGGRLAYGELWRTGANEPTMIHTSVALDFAGIVLEPGSYSLYTLPNEGEWQIIINRSISQWGAERYYTEEVAAQELGRATVSASVTREHIETLTFRDARREGGGTTLFLEWERTSVAIPIRLRG